MAKQTTPAPSIDRLPKWAQTYIQGLERQRDCAVRAYEEMRDTQTPSAIYAEEMDSVTASGGPVNRKTYLQSHAVSIQAHGILLRVATEYGNTHGESITLSWSKADNFSGDIAFIPLSYQHAKLITKEKMR